MLDKFEYYHGAAIISLMSNKSCESICAKEKDGYILNKDIFVFVKYRTKARSPWNFTFDQEDIDRCSNMKYSYPQVLIGLVCGGDGVCGLSLSEVNTLLLNKPGSIAVKRKHNHSYSVQGSFGELKYKIPLNRWSTLPFEMINFSGDLYV